MTKHADAARTTDTHDTVDASVDTDTGSATIDRSRLGTYDDPGLRAAIASWISPRSAPATVEPSVQSEPANGRASAGDNGGRTAGVAHQVNSARRWGKA